VDEWNEIIDTIGNWSWSLSYCTPPIFCRFWAANDWSEFEYILGLN
jgi:hypothetical protein